MARELSGGYRAGVSEMSGRAVREMCLNPLTRRPRAVPCLARLDIEGDPFGGLGLVGRGPL